MPRLIPICEFDDNVNWRCVGRKIKFLDKLGPKNQFGGSVHFFSFALTVPYLGKFSPKNQTLRLG